MRRSARPPTTRVILTRPCRTQCSLILQALLRLSQRAYVHHIRVPLRGQRGLSDAMLACHSRDPCVYICRPRASQMTCGIWNSSSRGCIAKRGVRPTRARDEVMESVDSKKPRAALGARQLPSFPTSLKLVGEARLQGEGSSPSAIPLKA